MTTDAAQTQDEPTQTRDETTAHEGDVPRVDVSEREDGATDEVVSPLASAATSEVAAPREDAAARSVSVPARSAAEPGDVLRLQPRLVPRADGLYYVSEILAYHDEAFVEAAFASVLRRTPADDERRHALSDLRNGAREKIDILRDLARTPEGKSQAAFDRIAGLRQSRLAQSLRGLPVVGHLWRILAAIVRLPTALRHQRQFEAYALAQQQLIADHVNEQQRQRDGALERVAAELRHAIAELRLAIADASSAVADVSATVAGVSAAVADVSAAVSLLSDALAETTTRHAEQQSQLAHRLDAAEHRLTDAAARLEDNSRRLDAQQEFLVREQQAIVEAQKAALADAADGLRETTAEQRRELAALSARVEELRATVVAARESVGGKV